MEWLHWIAADCRLLRAGPADAVSVGRLRDCSVHGVDGEEGSQQLQLCVLSKYQKYNRIEVGSVNTMLGV